MKDKALALLTAVGNGDLNATAELLLGGADPNLPGRYGNTPLMNAVEASSIELIDLLIQHGADINQQISFKSPVDGRSNVGYTALFYARNKEVLGHLIRKGANVNAVAEGGITALIRKSSGTLEEDRECMTLLLESGADPAMTAKLKGFRKPVTALQVAEWCLKTWQKDLEKEDTPFIRKLVAAYGNNVRLLKDAGHLTRRSTGDAAPTAPVANDSSARR